MVVDSSAWIEILRHGPLHAKCEKALHGEKLRVPTLVLFEVYRKLKTKVAEDVALEAVAALSQHEVLELSREIAILAADLAIDYELAMADSIVLAHAKYLGDKLVTLDSDFAKIPSAILIKL